MNRYIDWYRQAGADLRHARNSLDDADYEWSCFAAHQAAEKALKAVFLKNGMEAWGHTLTVLIGKLPGHLETLEDLLDCVKILEKHYIPTRNPNGFDSGAPTDFYTRPEAQAAIECAEKVLEYCKNQID